MNDGSTALMIGASLVLLIGLAFGATLQQGAIGALGYILVASFLFRRRRPRTPE